MAFVACLFERLSDYKTPVGRCAIRLSAMSVVRYAVRRSAIPVDGYAVRRSSIPVGRYSKRRSAIPVDRYAIRRSATPVGLYAICWSAMLVGRYAIRGTLYAGPQCLLADTLTTSWRHRSARTLHYPLVGTLSAFQWRRLAGTLSASRRNDIRRSAIPVGLHKTGR